MKTIRYDYFLEMKKLYDAAENANIDALELLATLWKETKDKRIEDHFRKGGGIYIDGQYLFGKDGRED